MIMIDATCEMHACINLLSPGPAVLLWQIDVLCNVSYDLCRVSSGPPPIILQFIMLLLETAGIYYQAHTS